MSRPVRSSAGALVARLARAQGKCSGGWLFGTQSDRTAQHRQLNRAVHAAAKAAGIDKRVLDCIRGATFRQAPCSSRRRYRVSSRSCSGTRKLETTSSIRRGT